MADRPILVFPAPSTGKRVKKKTGFASPSFPSHTKQHAHISPQFKALNKALQARTADLQGSVTGFVPEQVIVLETLGTVGDFIRAVQKIRGLEWLAEFEEEMEADETLFDQVLEESLEGRLFLIMANQEAMKQLMKLWDAYRKDQKTPFPWGLAKFRDVFKLLRNVRPWNPTDRLLGTSLDEFVAGALYPDGLVNIEAELWYRADERTRGRVVGGLTELLAEEGGRLLSEVAIDEIRYHGVLAELPLSAVSRMVEHQDTRLVLSNDVMFLRPASQFITSTPVDGHTPEPGEEPEASAARGDPVVAILDGLPLANHAVLRGHLIIDDPDNFEERYPVEARCHGTAMASLVLRGDLHNPQTPLERPIYVRPVLLPFGTMEASFLERMPENALPVDLIHRAVRRMFEGDGVSGPTAPTVRVINFSIGDPARHFASEASPLARLLDWLSHKYGVLFVVSSGNHPGSIELDVAREQFSTLTSTERQNEIIQTIAREAAQRRLLSPAESVNALTIGACHGDDGPLSTVSSIWNPYSTDGCASPISALGLGYNKSVKPEVLANGGRIHFRQSPSTNPNALIAGVVTAAAPGQRVAMPAPRGELRAVGNTVGTSNAAALATRGVAGVYSVLDSLRSGENGALLNPRCDAALAKAALTHASLWGEAQTMLAGALSGEYDGTRMQDMMTRLLGYGRMSVERTMAAADERATLVGCGFIGADEAHTFRVPLPPGIAGRKMWRRLTLSLAWITPVNCASRSYRRAVLFLAPPGDELQVTRVGPQWQAVRRGTVQHEVLEGEKATAFSDGDDLSIVVTCKSDRSQLKEPVQYALLASIEVAAAAGIAVYDEVKARLGVSIPVTPRVRGRV